MPTQTIVWLHLHQCREAPEKWIKVNATMTVHLAAMLDEEQVKSVKRIAKYIRGGNMAPLIGAGLSVPAGVPLWSDLVRRLIQHRQQFDTNSAASTLDPQDYVDLLRDIFNSDDLTIASFIRRMMPAPTGTGRKRKRPSFRDLVEQALYTDPVQPELPAFAPIHTQTHNHLISLFEPYPNRLWTTNFDDLLEQAALEASHPVRTLHPGFRAERSALSIAHLHGFVPPPARADTYPPAMRSPVVMAEDDFHLAAGDPTGWTTREFISLLDRYNVLILGMSLSDPNLRRVLTLNTARSAETGEESRKHFAIIKKPEAGGDQRQGWYREYWAAHGVELVELPSHDHLLPFLARLRYETFESQPGKLWEAAAEQAKLFGRSRKTSRALMYFELDKAIHSLCSDFTIPNGEIAEMGVFLVNEDCRTLGLAFRSSQDPEFAPAGRTFSIHPDAPTGTAGRVFVASEVVRIDRNHELFDYGLNDDQRHHQSNYAGLISVPIIDWQNRGLPLGVVYITTTTLEGKLFSLPVSKTIASTDHTLDDVQAWLHKWAHATLAVCCDN